MKLQGWGGFPRVEADFRRCADRPDVVACLKQGGPWIPFGLGGSYGDSALGRQVLTVTPMDRVIDFNEHRGTLTCQAGLSLARLIERVLPRGWFPAVVPGTGQVTVGGAVAADVHGKNHHHEGCFSAFVNRLSLMLPSGEVVSCSPEDNRDLFRATCGGMGLAGIILTVEIRLKRVESAFIEGRVYAFQSLADLLKGFDAFADRPYLVAWVDCLAPGRSGGRFLLMAGSHAAGGGLRYRSRPVLSVPSYWPGFVLNRWTMRCFNEIYYRVNKTVKAHFVSSCDRFFFPLDRPANWNRFYGKKGLLQYQLVLPEAAGLGGLQAIFREISRSGFVPLLVVLKLLGKANDNFMSFPLPGYTLAMDYRFDSGLFPFFDRLDRIVADYGGRLYLAKDARMSSEMVRTGYPGLNDFLAVRAEYGLSEGFRSLQSDRLEL